VFRYGGFLWDELGAMADKPKVNHNVYILGAGFSFDGGIPLVKDFLIRMADSADWLDRNERHQEADAIGKVFEFRLNAAGAAYRAHIDLENIEDLFSLASASASEASADYITTAIAATIDAVRQTAKPSECVIEQKNVIDDKGSWERKELREPTYETFAKIITGFKQETEQENTIITFNYDTLLEDAFSSLEIKFDYGLPADKSTSYHSSAKCRTSEDGNDNDIKIYKLHGSVNWAKPVLQ
jgi:SIR2-like protein